MVKGALIAALLLALSVGVSADLITPTKADLEQACGEDVSNRKLLMVAWSENPQSPPEIVQEEGDTCVAIGPRSSKCDKGEKCCLIGSTGFCCPKKTICNYDDFTCDR